MAILIETPRLVLREIDDTGDDPDYIAALLGDPGVMRFWPRPYSRAEADDWIRRQRSRYASHGYGYWMAVARATGERVGQYGLIPPRPELQDQGIGEPDLGYMTHPAHTRKGYAAEAAIACACHALAALGRPRVYALIRPENVPSRAVARSVGFVEDAGRVVSIVGLDHLVHVAGEARRDGP